jgi:pyrroline-5-carboxylate reductase
MSTAPVTSDLSLGNLAGTLVLVGAGKMGGALLEGWLRLGLDLEHVAVIEPLPSREIAALAARGLQLNPAMNVVREPDAVVLAVKPQNAAEVMPLVAPVVGGSTVVLSIMAGTTLAFLTETLPPGSAIVRSMPNTPAAIGRGITVAVPNPQVAPAQRDLVHRLLAATGSVEWVDDEALLDPVTALSGSGPAYVFLVAEALIEAGVLAGLPRPTAATLATQTLLGSARLLTESGDGPEALRAAVTSPGGTTAAGLRALERGGVRVAFLDAVMAATERSRELGRPAG